MPLAPYSEQYWHADESLAIGAALHIFPRTSNLHAQLYADQAGTVPIANPIMTDGSGYATFFVENGDYWGFVNGQAFYLIIDLDPNLTHVWPATFRWDQAVPAAVWVIPHGLNNFPGVDVLDLTNQIIEGEVFHVDVNNLTITFAAPMAGVAFLRR